jgi:hypothetical protein
MSTPSDQVPTKKDPAPNPSPDDAGGDVPRPPHVLAAALVGGAVGGFVGALVGTVVEAMTH